ncbi:MAG: glycoside hydrolase family 2, partial [Flavisolibacter sp.]|nr:glycoside hydrolase family 2 [Flavisolibacter sp.]
HIERVALNATANGQFTANVFLDNTNTANEVSAQIFSLDGKPVSNVFTTRINKGDSVALFATTVYAPLLWTSETPNLYRVVVTLLNNGKPVHTVQERFGFRTVEVRERDGVYINGTKVKFKGVNHHSFWPSSGRALSKRISLIDVQLMKDMNMNAVRMSHYPADDHFYAVCDSLGLYVLDELAGWHGHYDTELGTQLAKAMIAKNGNHPSIVMWDNGNEGGHNYDLDAVFREADLQKRPVIHPWEDYGGFDTQHYREYNYGIANYEHGHSIVMPTEFLHGMYDGGHGAGLQDYWEAMWHNPLNAGGFLWDFADQGVVRRDKNDSIDTDKNRGADGIVGPYRQKEGSYFAIKEIWSPIHVERREITDAFDGKINIENRYFFTNTNQCRFTWLLKNLLDTTKMTATGTIPSTDIQPSQKGTLQLTLPSNWKLYDALYVTAYDAHQKEIFTWSFPIIRPADVVKAMFPADKNENVKLVEEDTAYTATANGITVRINKRNGLLLQVQNS